MNVTGSRAFAHRAASNITDELSRAGLSEKAREAGALFGGILDGLKVAAGERGLCVNSAVEAVLLNLATLATDAAEAIYSGDVFTSCREAERRQQYRRARDEEYAADPYLMLRASGLDEATASAYADGTQREVVLA